MSGARSWMAARVAGSRWKSEAGGEADGPEHAEFVFGEAEVGVADGADDAGGEVFAAVDEVEGGGGDGLFALQDFGVEEHAVDGEVAAEDVFAGRGGELDGVGAAAVGVAAVVAEGGDFGLDLLAVGIFRGDGFASEADEEDAEVGADGEGAVAELGEEGEDLVGGGGGGDVEVFGGDVEEEVADAAAGEESLVAGCAEVGDDGAGGSITGGVGEDGGGGDH